ncbi:hypothetical protein EJB05_25263 [Eragrostis curvula]|uniref:Uncharacterized protein n=1 Tax=Eragrostis curvula TaxID=38414 RepID=A0A5J9VBW6_9POAL|nr:hypothetical protein EJB05_25263 [Eragrostis curvula]
MDNASTSIVLRDGVKIHVKDADVTLVLGLPHKLDSVSGKKISLSRAAELVKINLGFGKHEDIRMEYIENLLIKDYSGKMSTREKIAFKVAVVLFVDAYFLAPKSSPGRVNHSVLPYLVDPDAIHVVNWSSYVLRVAKEASIKVKHALSTGKKSVSLDCCLLFLEVFYLDNLDTRYNDANPLILPRVAEFPYERIKQIMKEDMQTSKDGKSILFGKLKVKPSDQTVYGSDTSNVSPCEEATDEENKNYVMSRFLEFKEQLDDYRKAYVDQIEDLFVNLDYAMTEYVATACKSANKGVAQECSELTVACVQGQRYPNPISPKISNEQLQTPTLSTPAVSSVYSAGPSFDQSADRESGGCRLFLDGNSIIRSRRTGEKGGGEGLPTTTLPSDRGAGFLMLPGSGAKGKVEGCESQAIRGTLLAGSASTTGRSAMAAARQGGVEGGG